MAQSLSRMIVHAVFGTKFRNPWLTTSVRARLHPYMAMTLNGLGCVSIQVGGVEDHVHLVFVMTRTRTIAGVIEKVKTASSRWLKLQFPHLAEFRWQGGYGVFSVSYSGFDRVVAYVRNQEEHHRRRSFQREYITLLAKHQIDYDERYLWD